MSEDKDPKVLPTGLPQPPTVSEGLGKRGHPWLREARQPLNVFTLLLGLATVGFLLETHCATEKALERATDNTNATIGAATEDRLLPVVHLTSQYDDLIDQYTIIIRNIGFGPALNTDTKKIGLKTGVVKLNHRLAIPAGEFEDIDAIVEPNGTRLTESFRIITSPPVQSLPSSARKKPATTVAKIVEQLKKKDERQPVSVVCISYENAAGQKYDTWDTIYRTIDQMDLAIEYICQRKLSKPCDDDRVRNVQDDFNHHPGEKFRCPKD